VGDFLVGLDEIAAQAAARLDEVDGEVSLDVVLFSDFTLLDELEEPWETDAGGEPEAQASSVNWRESLEVVVDTETVMGSREGHAWAAAGEEASINGIEAAKEGAGPAIWTSRRLGDGLWLVDSILKSGNPGVDIIWVNCSRGSRSWLGRHCYWFVRK